MADSSYELNKLIIDLENTFLKNTQIYDEESKKLSQLRKESALQLDSNINNEFPSLKLENAKFQSFFEKSEPSADGIDKITFRIKTNPNSEMGAIKNVSSGGALQNSSSNKSYSPKR